MTADVVIPARYCGPPASANGGYACGVTAVALGHDGAAEVSLRLPPPLDTPLRVERGDEGVQLFDGEHLVSQARPATLQVDLPAPVTWDEASEAAAAFDLDEYRATHAFPTCFTCGPGRAEDDGLHVYAAPLTGRGGGLVAWPWVPREAVDVPTLWAALDCPSGLAGFGDGFDQPGVLGRMVAEVHRLPASGERLVSVGWPIAIEGRKLTAGSAVWDGAGELLAANVATWILLTEEQQKAFGART